MRTCLALIVGLLTCLFTISCGNGYSSNESSNIWTPNLTTLGAADEDVVDDDETGAEEPDLANEPNDTAGTATPVSVQPNSSGITSLTAQLSDENDSDYYEFTTTEAQQVTVWVNNVNGDSGINSRSDWTGYLWLYDSSNSPISNIFEGFISDDITRAQVTYDLPAGKYFARVYVEQVFNFGSTFGGFPFGGVDYCIHFNTNAIGEVRPSDNEGQCNLNSGGGAIIGGNNGGIIN